MFANMHNKISSEYNERTVIQSYWRSHNHNLNHKQHVTTLCPARGTDSSPTWPAEWAGPRKRGRFRCAHLFTFLFIYLSLSLLPAGRKHPQRSRAEPRSVTCSPDTHLESRSRATARHGVPGETGLPPGGGPENHVGRRGQVRDAAAHRLRSLRDRLVSFTRRRGGVAGGLLTEMCKAPASFSLINIHDWSHNLLDIMQSLRIITSYRYNYP